MQSSRMWIYIVFLCWLDFKVILSCKILYEPPPSVREFVKLWFVKSFNINDIHLGTGQNLAARPGSGKKCLKKVFEKKSLRPSNFFQKSLRPPVDCPGAMIPHKI